MKKINENLLDEVRAFITKERWDYSFFIDSKTSIQDNLKIFGDDASDFLIKFCEKYEIDYSDFKFDDYFRSEPSWLDVFKKKREFKSFTVGDLLTAIEKRKLR